MYSVVLAAALMTAPASSNHCWFRSHCHGCYSACSCYGGYAGYAGYAGHWNHCHGCYQGPVGYGCAGGCYGYHGGCYGGWGVFAGEPYHVGFAYGCYGGYACYGVPLPNMPPAQEPVRDPFPPINPEGKKKPAGEEVPLPKPKVKPKSDGDGEQTRATIQVDVPVGGKLFVDGRQIMTEPGTRTFRTPTLAPGETFYYDIRIDVDQNGRIVSEERRVFIRAAQEVAVAFPRLTGAQVAGARK